MTNNELSYTLDVLNRKHPQGEQIDWCALMGFLELHRVSTVFFNRARELALTLPGTVWRQLGDLSTSAQARNATMLSYIQSIGSKFEEKGIPYAFLKGSILSNALLEQTFPDLSKFVLTKPNAPHRFMEVYASGERTSNDIDILVDPKSLGLVDTLLKDLGFVQGYWDLKTDRFVALERKEILTRRMNRGETAPYILKLSPASPVRYIEVDINFSVDYLPTGNETLLAEMLANTRQYTCKYNDSTIRGLSPEHMLLHLLLHQYKEASVYSMVLRNKANVLYKYLDIAKQIRNRQFGDILFYQLVKKHNLQREVCLVLQEVGTLFDNVLDVMEIALLCHESADTLPTHIEIVDPEDGFARYQFDASVKERLLLFDRFEGLVKQDAGA